MSLINQMLRDLEQRNQNKLTSNQPLQVLTTSKRGNTSLQRIVFLGLILLLLAYIFTQKNPKEPTSIQLTTTQNKQAAEPANTQPLDNTKLSQVSSSTELAVAGADISKATADQPTTTKTESSGISSLAPKEANIPVIVPEFAPQNSQRPTKSAISEKAVEATKPIAVVAKTPAEPSHRAVTALYVRAQHSSSLYAAKEILLDALKLDPNYLPARNLLLETLLKLHVADNELNEFAEDSLQLFPSNLLFIKTRAHLYIQQKNYLAALDLLERIHSENIDDTAYLALLAASYQQLQRYADAVNIYQQLTERQPDRAENWLGLGISADKLNRNQEAITAYTTALAKKTLKAEVVDYINQRLSALN